MKYYFWVLAILSLASFLGSSAEQCGSQAGFAVCPNGLCCSKYGYCGTTSEYCCSDCQSQCNCSSTPPPPPPRTPPPPPPNPTPPPPPSGGDGVESIINSTLFDKMLPFRNDVRCPADGFYTYDAFIAAAKAYGAFGTTGDLDTKKREIAAFLAQTSHETTGGWPEAEGGPYAWVYCYLEEVSDRGPHCVPSTQWPCAPNQNYYGRGPIQISYNYNYGPAGLAIGSDLLNNPGLVATDPVVSFKTAFWFWMIPQPPKPSCHDVIIGQWTPSAADEAAGRVPGFGLITNIINGGVECGHGDDARVKDRIGFYKTYCDMLGVSYGSNLDCYCQQPFGNEMLNIIDVPKVASYSPN